MKWKDKCKRVAEILGHVERVMVYQREGLDLLEYGFVACIGTTPGWDYSPRRYHYKCWPDYREADHEYTDDLYKSLPDHVECDGSVYYYDEAKTVGGDFAAWYAEPDAGGGEVVAAVSGRAAPLIEMQVNLLIVLDVLGFLSEEVDRD
jgi:hypothetical protein